MNQLKAVQIPHDIGINKQKNLLFVGGEGSGIDVIDLKKEKHVRSLDFNGVIRTLVVNPTSGRIYLSNPAITENKNAPFTLI
ncbi:MAG: hypothetical protein ABEH43_07485, partial [Flavobacteriales bacterium]